jgi:hypothetical protein
MEAPAAMGPCGGSRLSPQLSSCQEVKTPPYPSPTARLSPSRAANSRPLLSLKHFSLAKGIRCNRAFQGQPAIAARWELT